MKGITIGTMYKPTSLASRTLEVVYAEQIVGINAIATALGMVVLETVNRGEVLSGHFGYYCLIGYEDTEEAIFWIGTSDNSSTWYKTIGYGPVMYDVDNDKYLIANQTIFSNDMFNVQSNGTSSASSDGMDYPQFNVGYGDTFTLSLLYEIKYAIYETASGYKVFSLFVGNDSYDKLANCPIIFAPLYDNNGLVDGRTIALFVSATTLTSSVNTYGRCIQYAPIPDLGLNSLYAKASSGWQGNYGKGYYYSPMQNLRYFDPTYNHVTEYPMFTSDLYSSESGVNGYHIPKGFLYECQILRGGGRYLTEFELNGLNLIQVAAPTGNNPVVYLCVNTDF